MVRIRYQERERERRGLTLGICLLAVSANRKSWVYGNL